MSDVEERERERERKEGREKEVAEGGGRLEEFVI